MGERLGRVRLGSDVLCEFNDLDYWMIPGLMYSGVAFMMGYLLLKEFMNTGDKELLSKAKSIAASYVNYSGLPNGMYLTHYNIVKREFIYQACTTLQMAEGVYWLLKMNKLMSEIEASDKDWDDFARKFCDLSSLRLGNPMI